MWDLHPRRGGDPGSGDRTWIVKTSDRGGVRMTRVVANQVEIEGHVYERFTVWSGEGLPPWPANDQLAVVGRDVSRVDAMSKVTGRATYTDDLYLPGMLFAAVLRSPHAHARVRRIDVSRVASVAGVRAVLCHRDVPKAGLPNGQPLFDRTVRYDGQAVAAVAADSEDIARMALRQISVAYETLDFTVDPAVASQNGAPLVQPCGNRSVPGNPRVYRRGSIRQGESEAQMTVDLEFRTQ